MYSKQDQILTACAMVNSVIEGYTPRQLSDS